MLCTVAECSTVHGMAVRRRQYNCAALRCAALPHCAVLRFAAGSFGRVRVAFWKDEVRPPKGYSAYSDRGNRRLYSGMLADSMPRLYCACITRCVRV